MAARSPGAPSDSVYPRSPAVSSSIARLRTTSDAPVDGSPAHRLSTCSPAARRALAAARISITANGGTWALAATFTRAIVHPRRLVSRAVPQAVEHDAQRALGLGRVAPVGRGQADAGDGSQHVH